jgi:hypothetical protein
MATLCDHRAVALPVEALSDIFDRLIWCLDDQGAALLVVRERWLQSDERDRVEVALAMDEAFPFADVQTMAAVFAQISAKWPELSARCQSLSDSRRKQAR